MKHYSREKDDLLIKFLGHFICFSISMKENFMDQLPCECASVSDCSHSDGCVMLSHYCFNLDFPNSI